MRRHIYELPTRTQIVWIPDILRPATGPDLNVLLGFRLGRYADDVVKGAIVKAAERIEVSGEGDWGVGVRGCEDPDC